MVKALNVPWDTVALEAKFVSSKLKEQWLHYLDVAGATRVLRMQVGIKLLCYCSIKTSLEKTSCSHWTFKQDNDPKHTFKSIKAWLQWKSWTNLQTSLSRGHCPWGTLPSWCRAASIILRLQQSLNVVWEFLFIWSYIIFSCLISLLQMLKLNACELFQ